MGNVLVKVNFYNILECGYYFVDSRKHAFCTTQETLLALSEWTRNKKIGETVTFQPVEDSAQNNVYCYDLCFEASKGALLTTWNGYEASDDNSISAINGFAQVGTQDIESTEFTEGYIPGFETYFWFPKERKDIFATVCIEGRRQNGRRDMNNYLEGFLATSHPDYTYINDGGEIFYKSTPSDENNYLPLFASKPARLPGALQHIKGSWNRVRKLRQQVTLCPLVRSDDRDFWQKWLEKINLEHPSVSTDEINFDTKVSWTPTQEELDTIIEQWTNHADSVGRIGVILSGEPGKTYWFDTILATSQIDIDVERNEYGIINAQSLLNALDTHKEQIFAQAYKE